ncbi:peptidase M50 family protein [Thiolapillus brandeum]|uniref:Zinc metalloprotease n=1 Tax=Thiolapillus brandeum TaxID=1076588 RepID=A0A7U6GJM8_9GAMM|nr:peptidase M50 family protein [Thiolapillus brandeum]
MKWSMYLGSLAGIPVYIHATFLILLVWIALSYWRSEQSLAAVINGVGFIIALFACVVLHELGHALTARRFGISTRDITLLPIGGVSSLEKMPDDPREEILVALAGPAVNILIAAVLWLWLSLQGDMPGEGIAALLQGNMLQQLLALNLFLALFNLLPAFPMDGGRVLRAILALRMDHLKATRSAAAIGQAFALWLGLVGLLYNPFLLFIALFVWIGAMAEASSEEVKSLLQESTLEHAIITHFDTLAPQDALSRAIQLTLEGVQKDFPVMDQGEIIGVLTQEDLLRGLQEQGALAPVSAYMQTDIPKAEADQPLAQIMKELQDCHCRILAVTRQGKLVGIINMENILELLRIEAALKQQGNR